MLGAWYRTWLRLRGDEAISSASLLWGLVRSQNVIRFFRWKIVLIFSFCGSYWYFLRFFSPHSDTSFFFPKRCPILLRYGLVCSAEKNGIQPVFYEINRYVVQVSDGDPNRLCQWFICQRLETGHVKQFWPTGYLAGVWLGEGSAGSPWHVGRLTFLYSFGSCSMKMWYLQLL